MKGLIAKLEAATEGSRELDAAIAWETGADFTGAAGQRWRDHYPYILARGNLYRAANNYGIPHYTTSLDAAMTLVLENHTVYLTRSNGRAVYEAQKTSYACVAPPGLGGPAFSKKRAHLTAYHKSLTLALCIAALKARALDRDGE